MFELEITLGKFIEKIVQKFKKTPLQEVKELQTKKNLMYLQSNGIYVGDLKLEENKYIEVFLFYFTDIDGKEYTSPIYVEPHLREVVRKYLSKLKPVHMLFDKDGVSKNVSIKNNSNNSVIDINNAAIKQNDLGVTKH